MMSINNNLVIFSAIFVLAIASTLRPTTNNNFLNDINNVFIEKCNNKTELINKSCLSNNGDIMCLLIFDYAMQACKSTKSFIANQTVINCPLDLSPPKNLRNQKEITLIFQNLMDKENCTSLCNVKKSECQQMSDLSLFLRNDQMVSIKLPSNKEPNKSDIAENGESALKISDVHSSAVQDPAHIKTPVEVKNSIEPKAPQKMPVPENIPIVSSNPSMNQPEARNQPPQPGSASAPGEIGDIVKPPSRQLPPVIPQTGVEQKEITNKNLIESKLPAATSAVSKNPVGIPAEEGEPPLPPEVGENEEAQDANSINDEDIAFDGEGDADAGDGMDGLNDAVMPETPGRSAAKQSGKTQDSVVIDPDPIPVRAEILTNGPFQESPDSHFFFYFLSIVSISAIGYIAFHNKNKILGLMFEGRPRGHSRRRPNSAGYRKLDTSLEEAMMSHPSKGTASHVIY